jgi:hypothetical protein
VAKQKTNLAKILLRILFPSPLISERIDEVELPKPKRQLKTKVNTHVPPPSAPADPTQPNDALPDDDDDDMSFIREVRSLPVGSLPQGQVVIDDEKNAASG